MLLTYVFDFVVDNWLLVLIVLCAVFYGFYRYVANHNEEKAKLKKAAVKQGGFARVRKKEPLYLVNSSDSVNALTDAVNNTVLVETAAGGHGSGYVVLTSKGWAVITNWHVVSDIIETDKAYSHVKIKILNQEAEEYGKVLRIDKERDVALVSFPNKSKLKPAQIDIADPFVGNSVYVIGTPLDSKLINTVTEGIISAVGRKIEGLEFIQSDVNINTGNSGGPLYLSKNMKVVGMAVAGFKQDGAMAGFNLFIPIKQALNAVNIVYAEGMENK